MDTLEEIKRGPVRVVGTEHGVSLSEVMGRGAAIVRYKYLTRKHDMAHYIRRVMSPGNLTPAESVEWAASHKCDPNSFGTPRETKNCLEALFSAGLTWGEWVQERSVKTRRTRKVGGPDPAEQDLLDLVPE